MKSLWTTFRYTYAGLRGQILGWGLGLALYGLLIVPMYETMLAEGGRLAQMVASYPKEFLAFFGTDPNSLITPASYLGMYAFSMMPFILAIFAVGAGSGLIASDEERGRLDLIIAHPTGRSAFFFGRFLGLLASAVSIMLLGWLGFSAMLGGSSMGLDWGQMTIPFLTLLVQVLVYATLALLLTMFLPARSLAAVISGVFAVISYFISSLAFMNETLEALSKFMPYHYFQTVFSFQGLNLGWLFGLLGMSALMTAAAWLRFFKRDIRLSGEGSWRSPLRLRRRSTI